MVHERANSDTGILIMPGLVAPEIPQTQNPAAPFLSAWVASSQINAKRQQLENQLQMMALRQQQMETASQEKDMRFGLALSSEQRKRERSDDLYYLGQKGIDIKEQAMKLAADKAAAEMESKQEKLRRDALGLFTKQRLSFRGPRGTPLPADALENTDINKEDLSSPGWHVDPAKPGKRFYNAPLFDPKTGAQITDADKKPLVDPITIDNDTFGHLKSMHDYTKQNWPTSKVPDVEPIAPSIEPAPADPSARQKGSLYQTPKGNFTWDGSQWQTP